MQEFVSNCYANVSFSITSLCILFPYPRIRMVAFKLGSNNRLLTVLYVILLVLIFVAYDGETSNVAYFEAFKPVGKNAKKVAIIGEFNIIYQDDPLRLLFCKRQKKTNAFD